MRPTDRILFLIGGFGFFRMSWAAAPIVWDHNKLLAVCTGAAFVIAAIYAFQLAAGGKVTYEKEGQTDE